jgi:hypothetical protein
MEWQAALKRSTNVHKNIEKRPKEIKITKFYHSMSTFTSTNINKPSSILSLTVFNLEWYGNWIVLLPVPFVGTPIHYQATTHDIARMRIA